MPLLSIRYRIFNATPQDSHAKKQKALFATKLIIDGFLWRNEYFNISVLINFMTHNLYRKLNFNITTNDNPILQNRDQFDQIQISK